MDVEPRYNIRAVEHLTGVPAPTLRSWERRYGFPVPARSSTARRLYSDHDIQAIRRVRAQTEQGLSAAQAIEWVQSGRGQRTDLNATIALPSPEALIEAQIDGMRRFDESAVESALTVAFSHYPADHVLTEIITPALIQVGDLWKRGNIPVAAEHFYSHIIRRRLLSLLAAQPPLSSRMTVALACLPGEQHELGLLMLALFLRWSGARVLYLGADQPIDDLVLLSQTREIDAICLSAGGEADWSSLETLTIDLRQRPRPPRLYLGGAATHNIPIRDGIEVPDLPLPAAAALIVAPAERSTR
ncbi:MAG: MerR family transcriptional regulator [Dehalococcoidia bacterium]